MIQSAKKSTRRGTKPKPALSQPDLPYTMKLPDGRVLFVEIPGRWVAHDRDGSAVLTPDGVAFLDRVRALATLKHDRPPSPGYLLALREALGLTQTELGERLGVHKLTVSRWECGTVRPSAASLAALEKMKREAVRKGVTLDA